MWKTESEWVDARAAVRRRGAVGKVNAEISKPFRLFAFILINEGRPLLSLHLTQMQLKKDLWFNKSAGPLLINQTKLQEDGTKGLGFFDI